MTWQDRPRWRGLPVPWVARWTAEVRSGFALDSITITRDRDGVTIRYTDEVRGDRDSFDTLWLREGHAPGRGEPRFGQIHSARHRVCMCLPRCQVCGSRLPRTDVPFLLPPNESAALADHDGMWITVTPPTCLPCQDAAAIYCPALRGHRLASVTAHTVGLWGVYGDVVTVDRLDHAKTEGKITVERGFDGTGEYVHYRDPRIGATIARQQVVGAADGAWSVVWREIPDRATTAAP